MAFQLPPLPNAQLFDDKGMPTATMSQYWSSVMNAITGALVTLANIENVTLPSFNEAINAANMAAANANTAAAAASSAAMAAQEMAADNAKEQALVNSYINPSSVLTATPTTIHIAAHTRMYADGTSVAVNAGSVPTTAAGDVDYVFYDDPTRAGGAVPFQCDTVSPTQTGSTHVVGAITIPTTGSASGGAGPQKPGYVQP